MRRAMLMLLAAMNVASAAARIDVPFNAQWRFHLGDTALPGRGMEEPGWQKVSLPHTPRIEPYPTARPYQGVCWYRKTFTPDAGWKGRLVALEFGAAMHSAVVLLNGKPVATHVGGYLPFVVSVSNGLKYGEVNELAVRLDNSDNSLVPPGKPNAGLDFCCFGGLYRGARLIVTDKVHLSASPEMSWSPATTVFPRCLAVSAAEATLEVAARIANDGDTAAAAALRLTLQSPDGREVARLETLPRTVPADGGWDCRPRLTVKQPRLWHPDSPYLYTLKTTVLTDGKPVDEVTQRLGIRRFEVKPEGLFVNGKPFVPRGANRHNDYPFLGNAIPDNAQYRDAKLLKDAGFNFLRLAHYPQSPAFLDACDELGIFVMECIPGWQHFDPNPVFADTAKQNVRDMVRRDRHHPCVLLWEMSLNETYGAPDSLFREFVDIARSEYPGDQLLTCGDTLGRRDPDSIGYDVPYSSWMDAGRLRPKITKAPGKVLHREYGDYEFGGENSTSRVGRRNGEAAMLQQAWNYQWSHNHNLSYPWTIGDAIWVGIDHQRGCSVERPASECGALDGFRLPKFVCEFYRSQRDPAVKRKGVDSGPMVFIANYWTAGSPRAVVVYSNAEEVELFLNGRSLGRRKPDSGPDSGYGTPFDGGNARHLAHPPTTFTGVPFEPGVLRAVACCDGRPVAAFERRTPAAPRRLTLRFGLNGRQLAGDGTDVVWAYAEVRDAHGTLVPDAAPAVRFSLTGPGSIIGPAVVTAEAGVAAVLVRGLKPGDITVTAAADGLIAARKTTKALRQKEESL